MFNGNLKKAMELDSQDQGPYLVEVIKQKEFGDGYFELTLNRPKNFNYVVGQRIRFFFEDITRDYSLISIPDEPYLCIYVRRISQGKFSPQLIQQAFNGPFTINGPHGRFGFHPSKRQIVFIATGTGIAPFIAFVRSGITGHLLLYGARTEKKLHYRELFTHGIEQNIACISGSNPTYIKNMVVFNGTVDSYLMHHLADGEYDFYVCGKTEMIRDVTHIIDERFPTSRLFYETFY